MARALLPEPPARPEREALTPELEASVKQLRFRLIFVPFTFPAWVRLRRESPEAAALLAFEVALNVVQSVLLVVLAAIMGALLVFRQAIVDALSAWLIERMLGS